MAGNEDKGDDGSVVMHSHTCHYTRMPHCGNIFLTRIHLDPNEAGLSAVAAFVSGSPARRFPPLNSRAHVL